MRENFKKQLKYSKNSNCTSTESLACVYIFSSLSSLCSSSLYWTPAEQNRKWGGGTAMSGDVLLCLSLPTADLLYFTLPCSPGFNNMRPWKKMMKTPLSCQSEPSEVLVRWLSSSINPLLLKETGDWGICPTIFATFSNCQGHICGTVHAMTGQTHGGQRGTSA